MVDKTVAHSPGTVTKALHIACLNASGVRAPAYLCPLIIRVGEPVTPYWATSVSSSVSSEIPAVPYAHVSIVVVFIPRLVATDFQQESTAVPFAEPRE